MPKNQVDFRFSLCYIDHGFTLRQIVERKRNFREFEISVFVHLRSSSQLIVQFSDTAFTLNGVPEKFTSFSVRTAEAESALAMVIHPSWLPKVTFGGVAPFTVSFQSSHWFGHRDNSIFLWDSNIGICSHRNSSGLNYADNSLLLSEDPTKL